MRIRKGLLRLTSVLAIAVASVLVVVESSACGDSVVDTVVGKWKLKILAGGEIYTAHLDLEANNGKIEGRYEGEGRRSRISSSRIEGGTLFLEVRTQRFATPVLATFTCDVAGDKMTGEVDFDSGARSRSYDFEAQRISPRNAASGAVSPGPKDTAQQAEAAEVAAVSPSGPSRKTLAFRRGVDGYNSVVDAEIWAIAPGKSLLTLGTMTTDGNNGGGESQVLLRFDKLIGDEVRSVSPGSRVVSATLTVVAFDPGTTVYLHRLLVPWMEAVTWDAMASGVSIDNVEASTVRDGFTFGQINMDKQSVQFDVTATVQKWVDGEPNHGWVFVNTGSNGWDFYSSDWIEADLRPMLRVEFEDR